MTKAAESFCDGVSQDIPIWENKVYRERPVLTRSERPIIDHRRWAGSSTRTTTRPTRSPTPRPDRPAMSSAGRIVGQG